MPAVLGSPFPGMTVREMSVRKSVSECWKSYGEVKVKLSKSRLLKLFDETEMEMWSKSLILGAARKKEMKIQKFA